VTKRVVGVFVRFRAIVSSLFPSNVRDRILKAEEQVVREMNTKSSCARQTQAQELLEDEPEDDRKVLMPSLKPIADLFPETTHVCGLGRFTAWSFCREPSQVFNYWRQCITRSTRLLSAEAFSRPW
jgi:hypothetical protein